MTKSLRWRIPLIAVVVAIAIMILYPPSEKILKREQVKEIDGRVVDRTTLEKSWARFFVTDPVVRETVVKEEVDGDGKTIRNKIVEQISKGKIKLGLDLKGGSELLYKVRVDEEERPGITNEIIEVLKKRIDPQGVMEYRIQEQGSRRILIQVPGATKTEIENLKNRITRLGKLEFRLAASPDSPEYRDALEGKQVPGYYKHWIRKRKGEEGDTGKWFLIRNKIAISGEHLSRIYADRKGVEPVVGFEFDAIGKSKFGQITERNIGKPLAIILDGILYSAPVIRDRIPGAGIIEGNFTQDEVNELIAIMRAGSLPADLELEMETMVGPSLGRDAINRGLIAGIIGGSFALLFIGTYYLGVGWVANFANLLNVFLVVVIMVLLKATLTLPGIAGLVLILGMGIDSNVLIFERIREERSKGKPIRAAVKAGYERAFSAIFDSNVTTFITGIILAAIGTGPVKGFAWTLILGMIINLFTAIFVTRVLYDLFMDLSWLKNFSMFKLIGIPRVKFIDYRFIMAAVSGICIITGMTMFALRGSKKYDIDFTGGTLVHLHLDNPKQPGFVRNALAEANYEEAEVQSFWAEENLTQFILASDEFGIRIKELNDEKIKEKLTEDIKQALDNTGLFAGIDFIEPTVFNLKVQKPIEEKSIRDMFKQAGYSEEDILALIPAGQPAKKYSMDIRGPDDAKKHSQIVNAAVDGLKNKLIFRTVHITVSDITEMMSTQDVGMVSPKPFMDVELNEPVEPDLLNYELSRMGFRDITVKRQSQDSEKTRSRSLRIEGSRSVLQDIKQAMNEQISLPSISIEEDTIYLELKEGIGKEDFMAIIAGIKPVRNVVKNIYTLDAPSEIFAVQIQPLNAAKVQEKIREDIIHKFRDNLYKERIEVSFEPLKDVSEGAELASTTIQTTPSKVETGREKEADQVLVRMMLSKPLKKEAIEGALASAGYPGILETGLEEGREYQTVNLVLGTQNVETVEETLQKAFEIPQPLKRIVSIGSTVANEMKGRAILAVIFSCIATIFYVWFRFGDFRFGSSAIITVIHDIVITLGAVAVADYLFGNMKIDSAMVAAFLTVIGYSLNDTIVIFDRIRENMGGRGKMLTPQLVNDSINQTLSRTLLTGVTTIGVLCALFFFGGPEVHGFAFVMLVGLIVGTYSTIFIACPMLLKWRGLSVGNKSLPSQSHSVKGREALIKTR
ncbi:MAG: protein translocase subunit SecD [wastewater metagenome]|nr:protein translocase subunit SecD [Candidatus Loosdrechtia aerotolerans]